MNTQVTTQGIVLKAVPYKDFHRIITLFSPDQGLVSLLVRGAFSPKKGSGGSTTPLTTVEVEYRQRNTSLATCEKIDILDLHSGVRRNLQTLEAACDMLRAVTRSQFPEKSAPLLYQLLTFYLAKLPEARCPASFSSSFLLKTLRHEGLLIFSGDCEICQKPLADISFVEGEFVCRHHGRPHNIALSLEEYVHIYSLTMCETQPQLAALATPHELKDKIEGIFSFFVS